MDGCIDARGDLGGLVADLDRTARLVAAADPELWSSPAARLYRARLAQLRHDVGVLVAAADEARGPVAEALAAEPAVGLLRSPFRVSVEP
ncbi:hypothetical protein OEB99_01225 [Actinotalea sp. M2MS4P-6]|uniref:hypothetical protein n=1 Tax=Actinotalea sp. M2MS4P-6 TaxID=2983762 RepID=UPI0021E47255|nr:hypothetical protein [Actinotalea sp. M2MS4P-6]MCV2392917.1 hypothetical protein [Actinotalea sp. M2MS4P-6]